MAVDVQGLDEFYYRLECLHFGKATWVHSVWRLGIEPNKI